jgi:pimeloyl-ACP methyl ester carboxylesterase
VRSFYEIYGEGQPTVLLLPTWSIIHSRCWKMQIPYLARHSRVIAFDGRGNGRSDRPEGEEAYAETEFAADALAVLDATGTDRAFIVGLSMGAQRGLLLAGEHPERVAGAVFIGPALPLGAQTARAEALQSFDERRDTYEGWEKYNRHNWAGGGYEDFLQFFFENVYSEAHSTKQIEDAVGWGLETTPETLAATAAAPGLDEPDVRRLAAQVRCPVLVIHGDHDAIRAHSSGAQLADLTGGRLHTMHGCGHAPSARKPVAVNLLLREMICPPPRARRRTRTGPRALYVSSPIGLGHARRDVAIADELRALVPGLQIDWLAQHPVTAVLEARGERIHPASAELANEAHHIEREAAEHDLPCFPAWRRMDEILLANFMVFHDVVRETHYDVWIGDEAWELDYYLHENPGEKRARYAWLTDFVGWLPTPEGGEREAFLAADHNAEMIGHVEGHPEVRDRAIFLGSPADIVPDRFGPGLPRIRDWTQRHYEFAGYAPCEIADREALRAELGYGPGERVCVVAVGGTGVGEHLVRRVIEAYPAARELVPGLRMIAVGGPRIDLPACDGVEVLGYVDGLYRQLAACDVAVVQGGLGTAMELVANRRPFLYFPLRRHFEQRFHVRHRLDRYRAGRCMEYADETPDTIAAAIAEEIGREVDYLPLERDGAANAAWIIAELLG